MRIMRVMKPITHIRTNIFKLSPAAFADAVGVTQPTVWRWENGKMQPGQQALERIRSTALERGLEWDDRLFFEAPSCAESAA